MPNVDHPDDSHFKETLTAEDQEKLKSVNFVVKVTHADGQKCERCWHWETDVGKNAEHPTICGRCVEVVKQSKT